MNTSATPLLSLNAVSLDTETTGLDAKSARIVEIAIVPIPAQDSEVSKALEQLVDPEIPIPAAASKIHGLTVSLLRGSPPFRQIAPLIERAIDDAVVIGHNIGYDLAVIAREHERAGHVWNPPRCLDVRALARIAAPDLASYSLDALCQWQGIVIDGRHRAFPDAHATALLFTRLIPVLRTCGIRTLAEAERATRNLAGESRLHQLGGWISSAELLAAGAVPAIAAIDSYPFRHRIRDLAYHPPVFITPSASLANAARALLEHSGTSCAILGTVEAPLGIIAAPEILGAMTGTAAGSATAGQIPHRPLRTIAEDDFLYRALGRMRRLDLEHLAVVDRQGRITGVLAARDLLHHRATQALVLGDDIEAAECVPHLGRAWARVPNVVSGSLAEGISPAQIAGIISAEIRALTAKAARIAEERLETSGRGRPPCPYAVLVLGSAGRGDSLMSADQDNAIVYAAGAPGGAEDAWFAEAGAHIADILNEVGIPYCPGGVMAKNSGCRHSAEIWKHVIDDWVHGTRPEDALASDIFFDAVPVYGDLALAEDVIAHGYSMAEQSSAFIAALAAFAKDWLPPIGMLGRIILDGDGRLDLKRNGLHPIVNAARTLALKHAIRPTSTVARLRELNTRSLADGDLIGEAIEAQNLFVRLILAQQANDAHQGIQLSARVDITGLGASDRKALKAAMRTASALVALTLNLT